MDKSNMNRYLKLVDRFANTEEKKEVKSHEGDQEDSFPL
jgi:hypothetical protein